jgi:hypothetical protein
LKDLCDVDSDPLIQKISNSLNAEAVRLLAAVIRIVDTSQGEGGGILKKKFWLCLYLSVAPNPIFLYRRYSLFHQDALHNPPSIPFNLGLASIHIFNALCHSLQKMSEKDRYCWLLFDEMSIRENVWFNQKCDYIE